jgi:hypothetical protein
MGDNPRLMAGKLIFRHLDKHRKQQHKSLEQHKRWQRRASTFGITDPINDRAGTG